MDVHGDRRELLRKIGAATRGDPNGLQRRALKDEYEACKDSAYKEALAAYDRETDPAKKNQLAEAVNSAFDAALARWRELATPDQYQDMYEAAGQLVQLVRDVFGMAPFNPQTGGGASEALCWRVWYGFRDACHDDKKKRATSPIGSTPTAPQPDSSQLTPSISG